ncbi:MAG: hypothetical protein Tsb0014_45380 [Pleurocapsa sp.]
MQKLLNLGCGYRFNSSWTNLNFTATGEGVIAHNLTKGIPFPDNYFDVVYHSHLLEHFPTNETQSFLNECFRVLRPQGVLRTAVPDLEQIAKTYLQALEQAISGSSEWSANYQWILLEMYDQTVRNSAGGKMSEYFLQEQIPNQEFVFQRIGVAAKKLMKTGQQRREKFQSHANSKNKLNFFFHKACGIVLNSNYRRELLLKIILGNEYKALQVGRFRQSGEVHQWMYDRYSLAKMLEKSGLQNIIQRSATESYIPQWTSFHLDTEPDGSVYKPDSLYIEAIKPSGQL